MGIAFPPLISLNSGLPNCGVITLSEVPSNHRSETMPQTPSACSAGGSLLHNPFVGPAGLPRSMYGYFEDLNPRGLFVVHEPPMASSQFWGNKG